eukprot:gene3544-13613_t
MEIRYPHICLSDIVSWTRDEATDSLKASSGMTANVRSSNLPCPGESVDTGDVRAAVHNEVLSSVYPTGTAAGGGASLFHSVLHSKVNDEKAASNGDVHNLENDASLAANARLMASKGGETASKASHIEVQAAVKRRKMEAQNHLELEAGVATSVANPRHLAEVKVGSSGGVGAKLGDRALKDEGHTKTNDVNLNAEGHTKTNDVNSGEHGKESKSKAKVRKPAANIKVQGMSQDMIDKQRKHQQQQKRKEEQRGKDKHQKEKMAAAAAAAAAAATKSSAGTNGAAAADGGSLVIPDLATGALHAKAVNNKVLGVVSDDFAKMLKKFKLPPYINELASHGG